LKPIYEELGEKYKDNPDIVVAQIDSTTNELERVQIKSFPTIKLFPKDSDEVIDYRGARTVDALSQFIDSNGKEGEAPAPVPPAKPAKEEDEEVVGHKEL